MKNKAIKIGIIASILPHLFCCVLPIVLSLIGLFAPEIAHTSFIPEEIEPYIFVFSAVMLPVEYIKGEPLPESLLTPVFISEFLTCT